MEWKKKKIVIVTGLSGSGKTTALNVLEDMGYYTVDNLPCEIGIPFVMTDKLNNVTKTRYVFFVIIALVGWIATTYAHDHHNLMVIGKNIKDMTKAINRIIELQGGICCVENEEILAEVPLPVAL